MNKTLVLEGKIVRILNSQTFIINLGSNDGVRTGTTFVIQGEPEEIRDPDTNQVLGTIEKSKGQLTVYQVMQAMCIAAPRSRYETEFIPSWPLFKPAEIPVRDKDIKPLASVEVKVGDVVTARIAIEEEKAEEEKET